MAEICRRLDTEHGQESPQEVYDTMLRSGLGFGWDELKEKGFYQPEFKWHKYEENCPNTNASCHY